MSYEDLPVFNVTNGYPKSRMDEIVREISDSHVCSFKGIMESTYPKLIPWCKYIDELNEASVDPNFVFIPTIELAKAEYDNYFIDVPWLATTVHVLMIIIAVISVIGIFGNFLCLPWLNSVSNRTGATLYMTIAAICDIFYIIGISLLFFYQMFHNSIDTQLQVYQNWTVTMVPIGLPITNFFNLLSTWLIVALLIDRLPVAAQTISPQADLNLDEATKAAVYRKRSRCRYTIYFFIMFLFFTIYTVPMCFEYVVSKHLKARQPMLSFFLLRYKQYKITMLIVLRPVVEIFLPSVLLIWYLVLIRDKKFGLKQRSQGYFVPHLIKNWEDYQPNVPQASNEPGDTFEAPDKIEESPVISPNLQSPTYMLQPVLDLSFLECKRWRNESIVSRMTINIAFIYFMNMLVQAMCYFVRLDVKTNNPDSVKASREVREIFFYLGLIINVFVVSMKPITYLLTSKTVIKEFKEIQKAANALRTSRASTEERDNDCGSINSFNNHHQAYSSGLGWRLMKNSPEGERILI